MKTVEIDFNSASNAQRVTRCDEDGIPSLVQLLYYQDGMFVVRTWRGVMVHYHPRSLGIYGIDENSTPSESLMRKAEGCISRALLRAERKRSIICPHGVPPLLAGSGATRVGQTWATRNERRAV